MNSSYKQIEIFLQDYFQTKLSQIAPPNLEMSSIQKLLSEKGKPMVAYDSYVNTLERTMTNQLIFKWQNRDCKNRCSVH